MTAVSNIKKPQNPVKNRSQPQIHFNLSGLSWGIAIAGVALGFGIVGHGYLTSRAIQSQNPFWLLQNNTQPFSFSMKAKEQNDGMVWNWETDKGIYSGRLKADPLENKFELYGDFIEK
ncbi:MAG: hypothetical protein AAFO04_02610 [Cyanobacteria bacterium J06592_8]